MGPHFVVDGLSTTVRLVALIGALLTALNLSTDRVRGVAVVPLSALGVILLASAVTVGGLLLSVAATVLGGSLAAWFSAPVPARPAVRRWHGTATVGFALTFAGAVLWSGLSGTLHLDRALADLAVRPSLPPLALPTVLAILGVGLALALLGEPGRFRNDRAAVPAPLTAWLTFAPPLGLVALLGRLLQRPPEAPTLAVLPELFAAFAGVLIVAGFAAALVQRDLGRRLAWAAAGQVGLALLGFATLVPDAGARAALSQLVVFAPAQLGALLLVRELSAHERRAPRWTPAAVLLSVFLVSLAALPPLAGWRPRFELLGALMGGDLPVVGGLAAVGTWLGCAVYLLPLGRLWREGEGDAAAGETGSWMGVVTAVVLLAVVVAWGVGVAIP